jgi:hypothetical protein
MRRGDHSLPLSGLVCVAGWLDEHSDYHLPEKATFATAGRLFRESMM